MGNLSTYSSGNGELTCAGDGTLFTRLIPGSANVVRTAAHFLGHVEQQFSIAGLVVSIIVSIAQTSPHVYKEGIGDVMGKAQQVSKGILKEGVSFELYYNLSLVRAEKVCSYTASHLPMLLQERKKGFETVFPGILCHRTKSLHAVALINFI